GQGYTTATSPTPNPQAIMSTVKHPLEPLTEDEVRLAVSLLKDAGKVNATTRFVSVSLKEPPKAAVYNGTESERQAFGGLFDNAANSAYEATLSLTGRKLLNWKHVPGAQPTMTIDEQVECEQAVLASPEFKAALKKQYGVEDTS